MLDGSHSNHVSMLFLVWSLSSFLSTSLSSPCLFIYPFHFNRNFAKSLAPLIIIASVGWEFLMSLILLPILLPPHSSLSIISAFLSSSYFFKLNAIHVFIYFICIILQIEIYMYVSMSIEVFVFMYTYVCVTHSLCMCVFLVVLFYVQSFRSIRLEWLPTRIDFLWQRNMV